MILEFDFDSNLRVLAVIAISISVAQGLTRQPISIADPTSLPMNFCIDSNSAPERIASSHFGKHLEMNEISKKDREPGSIVSLIYGLTIKLKELRLSWLINAEIFSKILQKGTDRELHFPIGVTHRVLEVNHRHKLNAGFCAKPRTVDTPASRRNAGENFVGIQNTDDGYTLISIISGHSGFNSPDNDSTDLCEKLDFVMSGLFYRFIDKSALTPKKLVNSAWDVLQGVGAPEGCVSVLQALISPQNEIRVTNLGQSWAGTYRDGELVQDTELQMHEDGSEYRICNGLSGNFSGDSDLVQDSEEYTWQAQEGDIFVVVSKGVSDSLTVEEIGNAFLLIKTLGPEADPCRHKSDLDLYSMGIVKAARISSRDQPNADMLAAVVSLGPAICSEKP